MSRRSSRRPPSRPSSVTNATTVGLRSLVAGNEAYVARLLSVALTDTDALLTSVLACMRMNDLSAELLLARFFDATVLSRYCTAVLDQSGKGSVATLAARVARAWSHPGFDVTTTTTKKKKKKRQDDDDESGHGNNTPRDKSRKRRTPAPPPPDDDWKAPLFYWQGTLSYDPEQHSLLRWEGSWVAALAEDGLPSPKEFEAARTVAGFRLTARVDDPALTTHALSGLVGTFRGTYLLEQGDDGPTEQEDTTHEFAVGRRPLDHHGTTSSSDTTPAVACGTTPFGNFVSVGWVADPAASTTPSDDGDTGATTGGTDTVELVLARRYLDEADTRNAWVKSGAKTVLAQCCDDGDRHHTKYDPNDAAFWANVLPRKCFESS